MRVPDERDEERTEAALRRTVVRASESLSELIARPLEPGLYLVATPIGNLADISLRALAVLARADLIAAEDTRHSKKLLTHFGISGELAPYHEHNAERERPKLMARLGAAQSVALISDAGTPLISDPGYKLVREALDAGVAGDEHSRSIGRARRPDQRGASHRHLPLCRFPAAEAGRAPKPARGTERRAGNSHLLRDGAHGSAKASPTWRSYWARARRRSPRS